MTRRRGHGIKTAYVVACIFMETLEKEEFSKIMGDDTTWLRYVDDVLIIAPQNLNLPDKLEKLNEVHENIKFTLEEEENQTLNFLDVTIIRGDDGVKFKVYRKPTNKEDYIHFYSSHSIRTKSGVAIVASFYAHSEFAVKNSLMRR